MSTWLRWWKFNLVGAVGIAVQLAVLSLLVRTMSVQYLIATMLAVEAAIVHNFLWHERFTWRDRPQAQPLRRFLRFNFSNGLISLAGNILVMKVLVGIGGMNYLASDAVAIALCSLANFLVSDRWVFDRRSPAVHPDPNCG